MAAKAKENAVTLDTVVDLFREDKDFAALVQEYMNSKAAEPAADAVAPKTSKKPIVQSAADNQRGK